MLKRLVVIMLVLFSLFIMIDFVPNSDAKRPPPKKKSTSSESCSSESCSSESCSPNSMDDLRNQNNAQEVELPESINVAAEPKEGSSHPPGTKVKITASSEEKITPKPGTGGCGTTHVKEETKSVSGSVKKGNKGVKVTYEEKEGSDDSKSKKVTLEAEYEF
ncbi:hypothetical protein F4009_09665 [Candidatus Poribacteria bacterium]|nr:hypothetical protein [Candidatus Poribacteria bacterium]